MAFNIADLCPPGTYLNLTTDDCVKCTVGQYQSQSGQTACDSCPEGTSTRYEGSQNEMQCVGMLTTGRKLSTLRHFTTRAYFRFDSN